MLCSRPCSCSSGLSRRQACGSLRLSGSRRRPDSSRSVVAFGKKGKKKGGGGGGGSQAATTEAAPPDEPVVASSGDGELDVTNAIKACKDKMSKAIANVQSNFDSVRTGRANPAMLDNIEVEYYGSMAPLNTVAGISVPEASTLVVKPFDTSALGDIEKAILASDLGITPNNDGQQIRLSIPDMTEERRKELTKTVGKYAEEGKVAIRNVRRDAMKVAQRCEKDGLISKDRLKEAEDEVQKITDGSIKKLEDAAAAKDKDVMTL
ncbi:ribosome-recycling factor [Pycnococcus provasolii]